MKIGSFKSNAGQLLGSVATATLHMPRLGLRPVHSENSRAPAFEIVALNPGKVWVQVGALWEGTRADTGETFYQGRIDDPSLPEELPIALFRNDGDDGVEAYAVAWSRPKATRNDGFGNSNAGNGQRGRQVKDDGFGTGNATDNGQLVGAAAGGELDDQIPF